MSTAEKAVAASEAKALFSDLKDLPALVMAISGGPDSTALMLLMARWRKALKAGPALAAVTVDHGLRKESKREAAAVARLARKLGIRHRTLRWHGRKPRTGLQKAAREARYRLLAEVARRVGAAHIVTAHTLDDQAETVLIRMSRGSGIGGLAAMSRIAPLPADAAGDLRLVRPLLDIPKVRLLASLRAAGISFADDPSNRDPRFTRARLRGLLPQLAQEGLDARRLGLLARRFKRADMAIEAAVDRAGRRLEVEMPGRLVMEAGRFAGLPTEVALRLLGRALGRLGHEGPVELGKLEALQSALEAAQKSGNSPFRRSLAGALVTLAGGQIRIEAAPRRRGKILTKRRQAQARPAKQR